MAPRKKRIQVKDWLFSLFSSKGEVRYTPDGPQRHPAPGSFFSHAQDFALHNAAMTSVQGDHATVTYLQGDRTIVPQIMALLSQHIIRGAAHDSSARTPPPRCNPDTRVKLITRIIAWFDGQGREESVLWITGPAGVGKSAVVQTFAEHLFKVKLLAASVFFSRPNKRNNPHGVFITIAYQLATRIEAYRNFIVERLSNDPELLNGNMQTQFATFIVEPFVEKRIGADDGRLGILLDGLDELEGEDAQCKIIQLISNFAHEHPDASLVWIIASRPESHISNTFDDDEVRRSCWSEYIPIDSTEACEDVERFLRSSFKTIQKKYRRSVPSDWPSDTDFLKLTVAASGLFIYAEVVMQFILDPNHIDPVTQFELLLSVIDRSRGTPTKENPFIQLDAFYHEILSSIPSNLWPTAKRVLRFVGGQGVVSYGLRGSNFTSLRGMSILLGLTPHAIYTCVIKCHSTLRVPDWKVAHKESLGILHASFSDYLKDSRRSREFYVGSDREAEDDVLLSLLMIWNGCNGNDTRTVEPAWHQYCSKWDSKPPTRAITRFYSGLFQDVISYLSGTMKYALKMPVESPIYAQLHKVHMIRLSSNFHAPDVESVVDALMSTKVDDIGFLREIYVRDLKFGHLDWKSMSPALGHSGKSGILSRERFGLRRPRSKAALETFVSELEFIQQSSPQLEAVVFGGVPEERVAVFRYDFTHYYIIPYPE